MLDHVERDKRLSAIPKAQQRVKVKSLEDYVCDSDSRNLAIVSAYRSGAFTLAEIGEYFGLHYFDSRQNCEKFRALDIVTEVFDVTAKIK